MFPNSFEHPSHFRTVFLDLFLKPFSYGLMFLKVLRFLSLSSIFLTKCPSKSWKHFFTIFGIRALPLLKMSTMKQKSYTSFLKTSNPPNQSIKTLHLCHQKPLNDDFFKKYFFVSPPVQRKKYSFTYNLKKNSWVSQILIKPPYRTIKPTRLEFGFTFYLK